MSVLIRAGRAGDAAALGTLDRRCWSLIADVVPAPGNSDKPFFGPGQSPDDVLVATRDGVPVGWVRLVAPTELPSNSHVQQLQGLCVDPDARGKGLGRALISAAMDLARSRAAHKVCLRVLSTNEPALSLYRAVGFTVEGVLVDEFFIDGRHVDDILMARFDLRGC